MRRTASQLARSVVEAGLFADTVEVFCRSSVDLLSAAVRGKHRGEQRGNLQEFMMGVDVFQPSSGRAGFPVSCLQMVSTGWRGLVVHSRDTVADDWKIVYFSVGGV